MKQNCFFNLPETSWKLQDSLQVNSVMLALLKVVRAMLDLREAKTSHFKQFGRQ